MQNNYFFDEFFQKNNNPTIKYSQVLKKKCNNVKFCTKPNIGLGVFKELNNIPYPHIP